MDIIWKIVNFIILFGALYLICRKMNLFDKMFGSRRRGIGEEIENSEKAKAQAKALGEDIEKARAENEERKQIPSPRVMTSPVWNTSISPFTFSSCCLIPSAIDLI